MSDPTNPATFTVWDSIKDMTNGYKQYRIPFDLYTGTDSRIAFLYPATATFNTINIDDFCFEPIPSCEKAPSVQILNAGVDSTSMDIGWNLDSTQVSYMVAYGPTGYDPITNPAGGDTNTTTINFETVTGLRPLTEYCFWVKAICTNGDTSFWDGPHCGTTGCPAGAGIPYSQNFSTYTNTVNPTCWEEGIGALRATGTSVVLGTSQWIPDGFGNVGTTGSARMEIWSTNRHEWLISPGLNLGSTLGRHIRVEFDIAATNWNTTAAATFGPDDTLALVISRNNGLTWSSNNIIAQWTASNVPSATGSRVVLDLPNETGNVKFGFYATSTVSNQDNNVYIDNFFVYDSVFVGLNEIQEFSNFRIYPNPNTGIFTILNEGGANKTSVKVLDVQGRMVYDETYFFSENGRKVVDIHNLNAGVYILLLQSEGKLEQHRIILSK